MSELFSRVISECDVDALPDYIVGSLVSTLTPAKLRRLHALFPGWRAEIQDVIADETRAVVRYRVQAADPSSLLTEIIEQTVMLTFHDGRFSSATPIIDSFDLWRGADASSECADNCACHPVSPLFGEIPA
ncbi:nuclear transport factor 2 family protein [Achromobacter pestifer]